MNIKNWLTLTIRAVDFNLVLQQPELVEQLRKLTLDPYSGMNWEIDRMSTDIQTRPINVQAFLAYRFRKLVGWAFISKESTDFHFPNRHIGFNKEEGWMFQVFIAPKYRRQGIGSELYKKALTLVDGETICVCPWSVPSRGFYNKFSNPNRIEL